MGAEQLLTDKDRSNLWNPGLLPIFFFFSWKHWFSIKLFFFWLWSYLNAIISETCFSPIDPCRLFIDGDKYYPTFLFTICCQTCQRAWLNRALQREFFSGFGFSSQFPSLSNRFGLFHIHFPEPQERSVCRCGSSAGKPRKAYVRRQPRREIAAVWGRDH